MLSLLCLRDLELECHFFLRLAQVVHFHESGSSLADAGTSKKKRTAYEKRERIRLSLLSWSVYYSRNIKLLWKLRFSIDRFTAIIWHKSYQRLRHRNEQRSWWSMSEYSSVWCWNPSDPGTLEFKPAPEWKILVNILIRTEQANSATSIHGYGQEHRLVMVWTICIGLQVKADVRSVSVQCSKSQIYPSM